MPKELKAPVKVEETLPLGSKWSMFAKSMEESANLGLSLLIDGKLPEVDSIIRAADTGDNLLMPKVN